MFFHRPAKSSSYLLKALWFLVASASLACGQGSAQPRHAEERTKTLYSQGMGALEKGDLNGARVSFEKVIRLAPSSPEAHNSLGWVLLQQAQIDSAITQFRAAL